MVAGVPADVAPFGIFCRILFFIRRPVLLPVALARLPTLQAWGPSPALAANAARKDRSGDGRHGQAVARRKGRRFSFHKDDDKAAAETVDNSSPTLGNIEEFNIFEVFFYLLGCDF